MTWNNSARRDRGPAVGDRGYPDPDSGASVDGIAALVASWPLDRAEQVASAFTCTFIWQPGRGASAHPGLRERDVAATRCGVAGGDGGQIRGPGDDEIGELLAGLRVHRVHCPPHEARRGGGRVAAPYSVLVDAFDDPRAAATDHEETLRELREQIDVLWRTAQLRVNAMDPIDESGR